MGTPWMLAPETDPKFDINPCDSPKLGYYELMNTKRALAIEQQTPPSSDEAGPPIRGCTGITLV